MQPEPEIHFAEINTDGKTPRSRRHHHKTRTGCDNCKARKIKCDEQLPRCSACQKRDVSCPRSSQNGTASYSPEDALVDSIPFPKFDVNLLTMKLFYHFEHCTTNTLAIGFREVWAKTLPLSLDHKYMMHAILMMAAAHLHFTNPENPDYADAELHHQSSAISGLREALGGDISEANSDALFASSILLYHHAWTQTDWNGLELAVSFPSGLQDLIPLAMGVKGLVMETVLRRTSMWMETMAYSPRVILTMCAQGTKYPDELEILFKRQYHLVETDDPDEQQWKYEAFMTECRRLIPVIAVLKFRDEGMDTTMVTHSIVRYLFTWPVLLKDGFFGLMRQDDLLAHVILHHFFTAVEKARTETMWWSRNRSKFVLSRVTKIFEESGLTSRVIDLYAKQKDDGEDDMEDIRSDPQHYAAWGKGWKFHRDLQDSAPLNLGS